MVHTLTPSSFPHSEYSLIVQQVEHTLFSMEVIDKAPDLVASVLMLQSC